MRPVRFYLSKKFSPAPAATIPAEGELVRFEGVAVVKTIRERSTFTEVQMVPLEMHVGG